jgi:hypothetical protein
VLEEVENGFGEPWILRKLEMRTDTWLSGLCVAVLNTTGHRERGELKLPWRHAVDWLKRAVGTSGGQWDEVGREGEDWDRGPYTPYIPQKGL